MLTQVPTDWYNQTSGMTLNIPPKAPASEPSEDGNEIFPAEWKKKNMKSMFDFNEF